MANVPYKIGVADSYVIPGLTSQADTKKFITNPTIAAGDFKIWNPLTSVYDNLATTPTALAAAGTAVLVSWSAAEAAYVPFLIVWQDAAGAQWADGGLYGRMTLQSINDLSDFDSTADPVTVGAVNAAGAADFFTVNSGETTATAIDGSVVKEIVDGAGCTAVVFPAGAIEYTYTIISSSTLLPVAGVDVWVSTDLLATNIIWKGVTDVFGVARDVVNSKPWLDPGTYYFWKQRIGYSDDDNPDTEVVS